MASVNFTVSLLDVASQRHVEWMHNLYNLVMFLGRSVSKRINSEERIHLCRGGEQLAELLLDVSRAKAVKLDVLLNTSLCDSRDTQKHAREKREESERSAQSTWIEAMHTWRG